MRLALASILLVACGNEIKVADVQNVPPAVTITNPDDQSQFGELDTVNLLGTVADGNNLSDIQTVTWISTLDGALGTPELVAPDDQGNTRLSISLSSGTHTISLQAIDQDGAADQESITVVVIPTTDRPFPDIEAPSEGASFGLGEPIEFAGRVTDPNQPSEELEVSWTAVPAGTGSTVSIHTGFADAFGDTVATWSDATEGLWEVRLTATNAWDFEGTDTVNITVVDPLNTDADLDGFTPNQGDCDDQDPSTNPDAIDLPDGGYHDANCDGIDGDLAAAVFVAMTGVDNTACDLGSPCRTVNHAIKVAGSSGLMEVYLSAGQYDEVVELEDGIDLYGGYDVSWDRDHYSQSGHEARIVGGFDPTEEQYITLKARFTSNIIGDLVLEGRDASGHTGNAGKSSYVVHANGATLIFERVLFRQGDGADGLVGEAGVDASQSKAPGGANGSNASATSTCCDDSTRKGGGAGAGNSCTGGTSPQGGGGGLGGKVDRSCDCFIVCTGDCSATAGSAGTSASVTATNFGHKGNGGDPCNGGKDADSGRVVDGTAGSAGGANGLILSTYWYGHSGSAGAVGENGGGGGGGGGAGGCDEDFFSFEDIYGGGGGGGGAGGCAGTAGKGGGGGGGSFGVFAQNSGVEVIDSEFERGRGGRGGAGGSGGAGQPGGTGGSGGSAQGSTGAGGDGGNGGRGGHGGGGAGGSGGIVYGIFTYNSSVVQLNNSFSAGTGGSRGTGGTSPSSGASGASGQDGPVGSDGTCSSSSSC